MRSISLLCSLLASLIVVASSAARAEATEPRATIAVVGDSLADGMWGGLYRTVQKDKRYTVFRGAKNSVGFTGGDLVDMIERAFAAGDVHALVMMVGANDRRTIFVDGKPRAQLGTSAWYDLYKERVERFMDEAGRRNVPLVWLLLPVMRDQQASRDAETVNAIVTAAAKDRGHVLLVDTLRLTSDEKGAYQAHFADLSGQRRQMRAGDGVHFEQPAYELFADLVLKRLREASPHFARLAE